MNHFQAKHWERRYQYITPCSPETPFQHQLKGGEVSFTNPENLLNFLKNSEEGGFMWTDSEDLTIIADMYQIRIKVITIKRKNDQNPTVNWIYPNEEMLRFAEIPNKGLEMVLLHEDEIHYSLVVSKDSELATIGSLTKRMNITSFKETMDQSETKNDETKVKKELKKCQERMKILEREYESCEKELRSKTEEAEKLKSEVRDMKQMLNLLEQKEDIESFEKNEVQNDKFSEEEVLMKMKLSGFKRNNPQYQSVSNKSKKQLKCEICEYIVQSQEQLKTHIILDHINVKVPMWSNCNSTSKQREQLNMHVKSGHASVIDVKCTDCESTFQAEDQLNMHILQEHTSTKELKCGNCQQVFSTNSDLRAHNLLELKSTNEFKCTECGYTMRTQAQLSTHILSKHSKGTDNPVMRQETVDEDEFNCTECAFQGTSQNELAKHIKIKHRLTCRSCGEDFRTKPDLMRHRKLEHGKIVAPCRKNIAGNCPFSSEQCWWNHTEENETCIECYFCELTFITRNDVMLHRKREHAKTVKQCTKDLESNCPLNDTSCWFKHQEKSANSVFQKAPENPEPPLNI